YTCGDCWNAVEGRCLTCAPRADAAPPETRRDMTVRVTPLDLAQPAAPIRVDPMTGVDASTNGAPAAGPAPAGLPPELEPIDLAVARAEAQAEADSRAEADARAQAEAQATAEAQAAERAKAE